MNYGISILFRAIPLAMAIFCFGYGAFIYGYGDDGSRVNPEKPDVPLNKNDAFQKVQKRRVQEKR